ncbi:hypothetical protein [Zobellella maritima]|uniref:hypothetical protein n=1 Tax=Zobellella maritima TaxID=2059725 RepID=UPI000E304881|nr:hypothetical protein [Zobellella maritima]
MVYLKQSAIAMALGVFLVSTPADAESIMQQWKQGLSGSRLTSYSGSAISSNSTLTTINFCRNGRYSYYKEGSWYVPGTAGGASNSTITGRWDIQENYNHVMLVYVTDNGEQGAFPIYLQNNGRVNIGGTAFAIQQGGAGC